MSKEKKFDGALFKLATQLEGGMPERCGSRKYRIYSIEDLTRAYKLVKEKGMAVQTAADMCGVPESTLRDRVKGKINMLIRHSGPAPVLGEVEEGKLVEYLRLMTSFGYSFSRTDIINIATDYAILLGKREPSDAFTHQWYYNFLKRWPNLEIIRACGTKKQYEKATSAECLNCYFCALQDLMSKYKLINKPDSVFIVDEVLIDLDKSPPSIFSWQLTVKYEKYKKKIQPVMTMIASGNAAGARLPAFFIFPGKTVSSESIEDCSPGTGATCSDDGTTNCSVFQLYLDNHFLKFIERKDHSEAILVLYDGYRTHISPTFLEMYKAQNVHLFPVPPTASQLIANISKGIFGEIEMKFNDECDDFIETEMEMSIHSNICVVASKAYNEAVVSETLKGTFQRSGLHPFKLQTVNKRIDVTQHAPESPSLRKNEMIVVTQPLKMSTRSVAKREAAMKYSDTENFEELEAQLFENRRKKNKMPKKRMNYSNRKKSAASVVKKRKTGVYREVQPFFKLKFVCDTHAKVKQRKTSKRGTESSDYETETDSEIEDMLSSEEDEYVDDQESQRCNIAQRTVKLDVQREHFESALREKLLSTHGLYFKRFHRERFEKEFTRVKNELEMKDTGDDGETVEEEIVQDETRVIELENIPIKQELYTDEASCSAEKVGAGPTIVTGSVEEKTPQSEKCCVCQKYHPDMSEDGYMIEFATWGKCEFESCEHWTHLKYCCDVKVLRRHDKFYCPCHNMVN